jgi:hypothetical protein
MGDGDPTVKKGMVTIDPNKLIEQSFGALLVRTIVKEKEVLKEG